MRFYKFSKGKRKPGSRTKHFVHQGERYGFWEIVGDQHYTKHGNMVLCMCHCGTEAQVYVRFLKSEQSRSCGCSLVYNDEFAMKRLRTIWEELPLSIKKRWPTYREFEMWSLREGYKKTSLLVEREGNHEWEPKRSTRRGVVKGK